MNYDAIAADLEQAVAGLHIRRHIPLAELTTFRIGGPAEIVVEPKDQAQVIGVVRYCLAHDIAYRVIGLGSDLLVSDDGIDEVLIRLAEGYSRIALLEGFGAPGDEGGSRQTVYVEAGASNELVAHTLATWGLSGYEFACGIPGTIGGAAIMNAGAYDGDFSSVAYKVRCIDGSGHVVEVDRDQAGWAYRRSMMNERGHVVLGAYLALMPANREEILARMKDLQTRRADKQPLEMPSAGSTFKRPQGYFAGKLIQDAGLRGYRVGGAQVSEKHTGFVVNADGATAQDVLDLIGEVQKRVHDDAGVWLEPEVRMWGFHNEE